MDIDISLLRIQNLDLGSVPSGKQRFSNPELIERALNDSDEKNIMFPILI